MKSTLTLEKAENNCNLVMYRKDYNNFHRLCFILHEFKSISPESIPVAVLQTATTMSRQNIIDCPHVYSAVEGQGIANLFKADELKVFYNCD